MTDCNLTLEEIRKALAPKLAAEAVFDGWSQEALDHVAAAVGIPQASARLAFAGGAMDMIEAWAGAIDEAMAEALPAASLAGEPIRERIARLVTFRLEAVAGEREALRRALALMAMPQNASRALKLGWRSADAMWRLAGDAATDFNHYTKRAILAAIYAATLAIFVDDKSEDFAETRAFLARRIAGIMRFEKAKARIQSRSDRHFSPARFFGRLRYPAR